tara:strand:+ start:113 stop:535 length:423 start_codon:yes stop_codon:yes gene_type:complete
MAKLQIKTLRTNEPRKPGAYELWVAVLARAVEDALRPEERDRDCDRRVSQQWFRSYSVDFRLVCELAGRDPRYVREKVLERIGKDETLHVPTIRKEVKLEKETASKMKKLWNLERAWKQVKSLKYAQYQTKYNGKRHEYN